MNNPGEVKIMVEVVYTPVMSYYPEDEVKTPADAAKFDLEIDPLEALQGAIMPLADSVRVVSINNEAYENDG